MFQVLGGKALQVGVSNGKSWEREEKKKGGSICGPTIKDIAKEETSMFCIEKGTKVL